MLTAGRQLKNTDPAPEKTGKAKKQVTSKEVQKKATSKAGQLVDYRNDLLRTACKVKLPHLTGGGDDKQLQLKTELKNITSQAKHLVRLDRASA
jgi:hypothetical protein